MDGTHVWNLDGTYNIWMEPEHTQNGWNLFMFPNPTPDTLNWSVMKTAAIHDAPAIRKTAAIR